MRVGRIVRAVGLRGEVEVALDTDYPERFAPGRTVFTEAGGKLCVRSRRLHGARTIVAFAGIEDRTGAEALRGTVLVIPDDQARPLEPDEFWDHDLVGSEVVTVAGDRVGRVDDVLHHAGGSILEVGRHLLPFVKAIVVEVAPGRITIDPPPGLLEG